MRPIFEIPVPCAALTLELKTWLMATVENRFNCMDLLIELDNTRNPRVYLFRMLVQSTNLH